MKEKIKGKVFVVGDNIDTDQIIPACHLVYSLTDVEERKKYGEYAMSGLPKSLYPQRFVEQGECSSQYNIIVAGKNFGSGSSREQAPACLQIAGVEAVIASSYARIFYRNSINGAFLLPLEVEQGGGVELADSFDTGDIALIDMINGVIINESKGIEMVIAPLGEAGDIIQSGGIFEYSQA